VGIRSVYKPFKGTGFKNKLRRKQALEGGLDLKLETKSPRK
jgi:hypothetical protein